MFGYKLFAAWALSLALQSHAAPAPMSPAWTLKRALEIPNTSNIKSTYMINGGVRTDSKPCVFYNVHGRGVTRERINQLAAQVGGVTLYDIYYPDANDPNPFNPRTSPMTDYRQEKKIRDWFKVTSRAFAQVCSGKAYLIWDGTTPFNNPLEDEWWKAIWSTDEFDAIIQGQTGITEVWTINPNSWADHVSPGNIPGTVSAGPVWQTGQAAPPDWWYPGNGVDPPAKRWLDNQTAVDWDQVFRNMWGPDYQWPCDEDIRQHRADRLNTRLARDADSRLRPGLSINSTQSSRKRAPNTNGIEQNPEGSVFSPGGNEPWVPGIMGFLLSMTVAPAVAPPTGDDGETFLFNITMFDDEDTNVIAQQGPTKVTGTTTSDVDSSLPYVLLVTPGKFLSDPVGFKYAGWTWNSNTTNGTPDNLALCTTPSTSADGGTMTVACAFFADPVQP